MKAPFPILMYHSIDTKCAPAYRRWTVSPKRFAGQLACLRSLGVVPFTISDMAERIRAGTLPERAIALTFDDGLADFAQYALPVLRQFEFPATLFVTTGYVGGRAEWLGDLGEGERRMLDWAELATLKHFDVELGAHTHTHPQLDLLPLGEAEREITLSRQLLEQHTGRDITSFAYPHGYSTPVLRDMAHRMGFTAVCRVADALSRPGEDPLALSRIIVTEETSDGELTRLVRGSGGRVSPPLDSWKIRAWRAYRLVRSRLAGMARRPS